VKAKYLISSFKFQRSLNACKASFTLIELLLVIVVMGIAVAIAMPSFVHSFQGQRLSTAARTLTTVARYARSMAVLKQSDLALTFNLANGQVDLVSSNTDLPSFSRVVDGVRLQEMDIEGADPVTEGTCSVPFLRSGVCIPFAVTIVDHSGNYVILKVDALGSVKSKVFGTQ
jgi:prepilin-type N-terminal cleavage/methylation domain-containing protein